MKVLVTITATLVSMFGCIGAGRNSDLALTAANGERDAMLGAHPMFPEMFGIDLQGRERRVPNDLRGPIRLVVAAYLREQQEDVDTWASRMPAIAERLRNVEFYELPIIERSGPLFRWWLNNGMRAGVRDDARRAHVITIYTDVARFLAAAGQGDTRTVTVFLVGDDDLIYGKVAGPYSDAKLEQLIATAPAPR